MPKRVLTALALAVTIVLVLAAPARAGQRPDFSGVWKLDASASSASGGGRGNGTGPGRGLGGGLALGPSPSEVKIRQDASTIQVDARMTTGTEHRVYKFDGTESRNKMLVGGKGAGVPAVFTSTWDAARLVTTMSLRPAGGPALEYREVRFLAADGSLVVETTRRDLPDNVRRAVYRK